MKNTLAASILLYISAAISFACAVACIILGTGVLAVVLWMLCGALSLTGGALAMGRYFCFHS